MTTAHPPLLPRGCRNASSRARPPRCGGGPRGAAMQKFARAQRSHNARHSRPRNRRGSSPARPARRRVYLRALWPPTCHPTTRRLVARSCGATGVVSAPKMCMYACMRVYAIYSFQAGCQNRWKSNTARGTIHGKENSRSVFWIESVDHE